MSQQRPKGIRSNIRLVLDEEGHYCYPPTQRKDGTWRKPIRVRPGHEESEQIYVIKQRREPSEDSETVVDGTSEDAMQKHDEESVASTGSLNDSGLDYNQKEESSKKKGGGFSLPSLELYLMHLAPELPKTSSSSEVETKSTNGGSTSTNAALGSSVASKEVKKEMEGQENDEHKELPVKNVAVEEESMSPNSKVNTWLKNGRYEEPNSTAEEYIQAFIQRMDSLGPEEKVSEWNALVGNWLLNA